jgi:immunity protein 63 of polymorphic toxin system
MLSLEPIQREFRALCQNLGVRRALQDRAQDDGSPHVEVSESGYHYVVTERGIELERRTTLQADELLYWLACGITHELATAFELEHRVKGRSLRRLLFEKQLELLGTVSHECERRRRSEIDAILRTYPYDDAVEG